jgi:hypothetical protein
MRIASAGSERVGSRDPLDELSILNGWRQPVTQGPMTPVVRLSPGWRHLSDSVEGGVWLRKEKSTAVY